MLNTLTTWSPQNRVRGCLNPRTQGSTFQVSFLKWQSMMSFSCLAACHGVPPRLIQTFPRGPILLTPGFLAPLFLATRVPRKPRALSPFLTWNSPHLNIILITLLLRKLKSECGCCFLQEVCPDDHVWVGCTFFLRAATEYYTCPFKVLQPFHREEWWLQRDLQAQEGEDCDTITLTVSPRCSVQDLSYERCWKLGTEWMNEFNCDLNTSAAGSLLLWTLRVTICKARSRVPAMESVLCKC